ncbi:predicted protein [Uncinocarpus reesii 1704]|uniref:Uncharacterized protein n=1 Tax=Uncinocarpus reesii (strain UAMH 1704) TaxID=336963 RepID=C4JPY8_UNCRE|nr:uncharacterized protein UREG_04631 [Uncinocarpus reesii 1704]EEP79785.1 predicted protein [Uncinocarpus reesii 1704]
MAGECSREMAGYPSVLTAAALNCDVPIMGPLLRAGTNMNAKFFYEGRPCHVVEYAALINHIPMMRLLISYGALIIFRPRDGFEDPLVISILQRNIEMMRMLLDCGYPAGFPDERFSLRESTIDDEVLNVLNEYKAAHWFEL